ncbi:MAG: hypothetical protein K1X72_03530 [Pyrinomonadaceae bacterium]|nr:hypothetical protein [Pyrinomonadaceae bacterium]
MPIDPTKLGKAENIKKHKPEFAQTETIETRPDLVTLGFEGLGIVCFSEPKPLDFSPASGKKMTPIKETKKPILEVPARGEVAIIRRKKENQIHYLRIAIFQSNDNGGWERLELLNNDGKDNNKPLPNDVEITIKAIENPEIAGFVKYSNNQPFNRNSFSNQNQYDIRWLVDIEGELHKKTLIPKKGQTKLSPLYIENAEFYSRSFLLRGENKDPQPQVIDNSNQKIFIGHELGAKIQASKVQFLMKSNSFPEINSDITFPLSETNGKRYVIKITNTCDGATEQGDFDAIYEFLKDPSAKTFTLEATDVEVNKPRLNQATNIANDKAIAKPSIPTIPPIGPGAFTYVRFCGSYLASKQNGIKDILNAQVDGFDLQSSNSTK